MQVDTLCHSYGIRNWTACVYSFPRYLEGAQ